MLGTAVAFLAIWTARRATCVPSLRIVQKRSITSSAPSTPTPGPRSPRPAPAAALEAVALDEDALAAATAAIAELEEVPADVEAGALAAEGGVGAFDLAASSLRKRTTILKSLPTSFLPTLDTAQSSARAPEVQQCKDRGV